MGSLNPQHSAFQAGKEQTLRKPRSRKEPSSQLKAQLKCPLSGRAFLPLLNFPFPGPHHTYGNYSFLCFSATTLAPAPGPGKAWHTRSLQTVTGADAWTSGSLTTACAGSRHAPLQLTGHPRSPPPDPRQEGRPLPHSSALQEWGLALTMPSVSSVSDCSQKVN